MSNNISRTISFTGDQEYGNTFVAKACSLFDMFTARLALEKLDAGSTVFPVDRHSYISLSLNCGVGRIDIHAERPVNPRIVEVPITARDIKCHWMKKSTRERLFNSSTGLFFDGPKHGPLLFATHGFGKIVFSQTGADFFVLDNYEYGKKISLPINASWRINTSFFEDDVLSGDYPAVVVLSGYNPSAPMLFGADFFMVTSRISRHPALLAYTSSTLQSTGFLFTTHNDMSLDFFVPGQPGVFLSGFGVERAGYTPLLGGIYKSLLRKSRVKFIGHGVDQDNETTPVDITEFECGLSDTYIGGGETGQYGDKRHGPCFFVGSSDFSQPASTIQDFVGDSSFAYIQGTTDVGTLYDEEHLDDFLISATENVDYDWYWFSTINSATIHLQSLGPDGGVTTASFQILNAFESVGPTEWPDPDRPQTLHPIPAQSGCVVRERGGWLASCLKSAKVLGGNRNVFFITDYANAIHDQFDYNVFVNFGSGFTAIDADPIGAQPLAAASDWAEGGLAFVHNAGSHPFNIAVVTSNPTEVIKNVFSAHFATHTDDRHKELRFFRSKNYKWFALYNAVDSEGADISGVYELSGSIVSRIGDATGIEPVEIPEDESYFLMQDAAYGSISGSFDRLVGFFYDKFHYLEMQSREVDGLKRFVIKNLDNEEIAALDWGKYSFYETSEDCSVAVISHCSINGVSQSLIEDPEATVPTAITQLVNFIDGPFEFETVCRSLVYNFSIDIDGGYTQGEVGIPAHAPELASPYYGPPDREPPYGRKQISICYCEENVFVDGGWEKRHRHHVMVSPTTKQGVFYGDQYCMHRPGFVHRRVATSSARTLYRNCRQQRGLDPGMEEQVLTLVALPDGYFYERITDEIGTVDPLLLVSEEYVTDVIKIKEQ